MISKGLVHGTKSLPSGADVANWVNSAMTEMKAEGEIIRNAWRNHGYEWYFGDKDAGEQDLGGNKEGKEGAI